VTTLDSAQAKTEPVRHTPPRRLSQIPAGAALALLTLTVLVAIAVFAPMPSARVNTAAVVNPGERSRARSE